MRIKRHFTRWEVLRSDAGWLVLWWDRRPHFDEYGKHKFNASIDGVYTYKNDALLVAKALNDDDHVPQEVR